MDGSDRKSDSSPSILRGVDENGKSYEQNDKQTKTKRFMSSTISATSKFSPSKRGILAERNESLDNHQQTPNLDSKSFDKAASFDSSSENSRPYDPSTNSPSSRPKFLRYKRETEEKEGENDSVARNSAIDCPLPQLEGESDGKWEELDDESEELDDERWWGFIGALKLLILLLVLVLCTSYIVSTNSPTPSPVGQAVIGLRNMQDHVYEYVNRNLGFLRVMVSIGNFTDSHEIGEESGSSMIKGFVKHMKTESVLKAVIVLSVVLSSVIAPVVLVLKFKRGRNGRNHTLLPNPVDAEHCFESPIPDKEENPIESAANFLISEFLIHKDEDLNEIQERSQCCLSQAGPTIELLGEIEVTEMSTSLRSCGIKNSRVTESEVSSHSVSIIEKTTSICSTPPVASYPVDVQTPASLQISNDKKSMKKMASEGVNHQTTPLRRSSRIRNRATSP